MSEPAVVIRLQLESAPIVFADCLNDGEEKRLSLWLESHPSYAELVQKALELREEARAA